MLKVQRNRGVSEPKPKDLITHFENTNSKNDCMEAKENGMLMVTYHIREKFHSSFHLNLYFHYVYYLWLRRCATNWKVAGSIPDGFSGIFH